MPESMPANVDELIDAFESAWRAGQRPDVAAYLAQAGAAGHGGLLRELAGLELEYRLRAGETARVEDCLRRFPTLQANLLDLISLEFRVRQDCAERVTVAEYLARFPTLRDALPARLEAVRRGPPEVPGFEMREEIGRGGMGIVYRAVDAELGRAVAVKLVRADFAGQEEAAARFVEEARIAGRLQHPGVAPVHHLGTLADGRPFLAMKLIEGQTLAQMLAQRVSPDADLPRYLQIFEATCQTMAYAHEQGIVHRDLKPSNIMVGAFGEVQVMDWGLAKVAGTTRHESGPRVPRAMRETQMGEVLGTLAYMPPEQARGTQDQVDARSDVFALGAMLCEILTEQPPYANEADTLHAAQHARLEAAHHRLTQCQADSDLIALARRCLAPAPVDRPASAAMVLETVIAQRTALDRKLRAAERDKAATLATALEERKRRRLLLSGTGLVVVVLIAGIVGTTTGLFRAQAATESEKRRADNERKAKEEEKTQRELADSARKRAAFARDQALAALDATTTSITGETFTAQVVLTAEQKRFLNEVLPLYRELTKESESDRQTRERIASAAQRVGSIEFRLGRLPEALSALHSAKQEFTALTKDFPTDSMYPKNLGRTSSNLAHLLPLLGKNDAALVSSKESVAIFKKLNQDFPDDPGIREGYADAYGALALTLFQSDDPASSEEFFQKALDIQVKLAAQFPQQPRHVSKLALTQLLLGIRLEARGKADEAKKLDDAALALLEKLRLKFPEERGHRSTLALAYDRQGDHLLRQGRFPDGEREFHRAYRIREQLVAESPGTAELLHALAVTQMKLGLMLAENGKPVAAFAEYRKAIATREKLADDFKEVVEYRVRLAGAIDMLTDLLVKQNNPADAHEQVGRAVTVRERLVKQFPDNRTFRYDLFRNHMNRGILLAALGKQKDATAAKQQAIVIVDQLSDEPDAEPKYRLSAAMLHGDLGFGFSAEKKPKEADDHFRKAVALLERLTREFPNEQEYQFQLGRHYFLLGVLQVQVGEPTDGLRLLEKAIKELASVVQQGGRWTEPATTLLRLSRMVRDDLMKKKARE